MTRKRYIKLLMANGFSRNAANIDAQCVRGLGMSYADAYLKRNGCRLPIADFASYFAKFAAELNRLMNAFFLGVKAFNDAYHNSIFPK